MVVSCGCTPHPAVEDPSPSLGPTRRAEWEEREVHNLKLLVSAKTAMPLTLTLWQRTLPVVAWISFAGYTTYCQDTLVSLPTQSVQPSHAVRFDRRGWSRIPTNVQRVLFLHMIVCIRSYMRYNYSQYMMMMVTRSLLEISSS